MSNSGPENSIEITDSIFDRACEQLYLGLFARTTEAALEMAEHLWFRYLGDPAYEAVAELLELLGDIEAAPEVGADTKQGATYRQLAYIGHLGEIDSAAPDARKHWYEIAKGLRLSKRHAGHIIARLNEISQGTAELEEYVNNAAEL
jgi:hypothetical protein